MNLEQLNYNMFKAAEHLVEAGKHISVIDKNFASRYLVEAREILKIIKPTEEKITEEKLNSIISEILDLEEKNK